MFYDEMTETFSYNTITNSMEQSRDNKKSCILNETDKNFNKKMKKSISFTE